MQSDDCRRSVNEIGDCRRSVNKIGIVLGHPYGATEGESRLRQALEITFLNALRCSKLFSTFYFVGAMVNYFSG